MEECSELQNLEQSRSDTKWPEMRKRRDWSWRKVGAVVADRKDRNQAFSNETLDWFKACSITDTVYNFSNRE